MRKSQTERIGCAFAILLLAGASTLAQTPTEFTYQAQLKLVGVPLNDSADFDFSLWDDAGIGQPPVGGNQIGATQTVSDVTVVDGLFTVQLNAAGEFGSDAFNGDPRFIQIAVRSPHDPGDTEPFTTLGPRQPLTAAPFSLQTRGIFVDENENVGIGTTSPQHLLHVVGDANTAHAIYGRNTETVSASAGVYGESTSTAGYGVYGRSTSSTGNCWGVYGRTNSAIGRGVYGRAGLSNGLSYGVYGQSQSNDGIGVYGWASSSTGNTTGVWGHCNSATGFAGRFQGRGFFSGNVGFTVPSPQYPVHAKRNSGTAIYGDGQIGVQGLSSRIDGRGERPTRGHPPDRRSRLRFHRCRRRRQLLPAPRRKRRHRHGESSVPASYSGRPAIHPV